MRITKALLAPALVASLALGGMAPANAAVRTDGAALRSDIAQLDRQIDRAEARRIISGREAAQLDRQVDRLQATWRSYARGGFTRYERSALTDRIAAVRHDLQRASFDRNGRPEHREFDRRADYRH